MGDDRLNEIATKYKNGDMLTGEVKKELINVLQKVVANNNHQENRSKVTDDAVEKFMQI